MGKLTIISMAMFNGYVELPEGINYHHILVTSDSCHQKKYDPKRCHQRMQSLLRLMDHLLWTRPCSTISDALVNPPQMVSEWETHH